MQFYSFDAAGSLTYDVCGNLRSTGGFLHHKRSFDRWVFIFVKTGSLHLSIDGEEFTVSSGEYVFLPPCREHFGTKPSQGLLSYLWVHFTLPQGTEFPLLPDVPALGRNGSCVPVASSPGRNGSCVPDASSPGRNGSYVPVASSLGRNGSCVPVASSPGLEFSACDRYFWPMKGSAHSGSKIPLYFAELLELSRQPHTYPSSMTSCLLTLLLMQVSLEYRDSLSADKNPLPPILDKVTKWMRSNLDQDITILSAASEFDYSPDYLSSLFRKHLHMSFTRSLHLMRIDAAKTMLASQNCSIKEAAFSCGFSDEKYFMKVFREVVGMTPTAYKTQRAEGNPLS